MKKKNRVVKTFKLVKRSCSLDRYYRVHAPLKPPSVTCNLYILTPLFEVQALKKMLLNEWYTFLCLTFSDMNNTIIWRNFQFQKSSIQYFHFGKLPRLRWPIDSCTHFASRNIYRWTPSRRSARIVAISTNKFHSKLNLIWRPCPCPRNRFPAI